MILRARQNQHPTVNRSPTLPPHSPRPSCSGHHYLRSVAYSKNNNHTSSTLQSINGIVNSPMIRVALRVLPGLRLFGLLFWLGGLMLHSARPLLQTISPIPYSRDRECRSSLLFTLSWCMALRAPRRTLGLEADRRLFTQSLKKRDGQELKYIRPDKAD